jgi:DNA-binding response OmpR family regulator
VKVLVVSADTALRDMLLAAATSLGFEPTCAAHDDARGHYDRDRPSLVVIDMDGASPCGLQACGQVRALDVKHESFLLALTADGSSDDLQGLLESGADDYLIKPMTASDLRARLLIAERRMSHESRRREAEEGLSRARWLAGIGETSIALQHEINNPLTALLGHAELMLVEAEEGGHDTERLRVIHDQARRIAEVVKRLGRLRDPQTVEYAAGARMIDLSERKKDAP